MAVVCTASGKLSQCRAPSSWDEGGWVGPGLYTWVTPVLSLRMRGLVAGSPAASVTCFCSVQAPFLS